MYSNDDKGMDNEYCKFLNPRALVVVLGCGKFHEPQGRGCCAGVWLYWGNSENASILVLVELLPIRRKTLFNQLLVINLL